ncbi:MAG: hypothetical protein K5765_05950, partial [Clostridia bacterium]|nr:hypothetical protein [Clostridia bacterium]
MHIRNKKIFNGKEIVDEVELDYEQKITLKERFLNCKSLIDNGMQISYACLESKIDIRLFKKLDTLDTESFNNYFASKQISIIKTNENQEKKRKNAEMVKKLHSQGLTICKIASIMDKSEGYVRRCISIDDLDILSK